MEATVLFITGIVLLVLWLFGRLVVQEPSGLVHIFLLASLMLLLIAFLQARDAAIRQTPADEPKKSA
jgi:hypothetical protein